MTEFPRKSDAPRELRDLPGNCGPVAVWQLLRANGIKPDPAALLRALEYDADVGTFMIAVAIALAEHGLTVAFHTESEPAPTASERTLYAKAKTAQIPMRPPLSLTDLVARLDAGAQAIVLYETPSGEDHITPLSGAWLGELIAPNEGDAFVDTEFEQGWSRPGCYRQCVIVEQIAPVA